MKNITELEKRIQCLEKENQSLQHLLEDAGIPYFVKNTDDSSKEYDQDQGARILPRNITETDARVFFGMFWGRTDVYSRRTVKNLPWRVCQVFIYNLNGNPQFTKSL